MLQLARAAWAGWRSRQGGCYIVRGVFLVSVCLSSEISWEEELKEECGTEVSEYKQVAVKVRPGGLAADTPSPAVKGGYL